VKDVAAANLFAIACGDDSIFNIGTGLGTTINALFAKLHTITCSEGDPIYGPAKLGEVFKIYLDIEKAKCEIPWEPRVGLDEGLEITVEWFRKRLEGKSSSLSR
jgi:UDP-glucose 4-epimerase